MTKKFIPFLKRDSFPNWISTIATCIGLLFAFYLAWYQFFRIDDRLTGTVDRVFQIEDTLEVSFFILNSGNRSATIVDLRSTSFFSDSTTGGIGPVGHEYSKPALPIIINPGENHYFTLRSEYNPISYYRYSQPYKSQSNPKRHISYVGITWAATNSSGIKFRNFAVLGGIVLDVIHYPRWSKDSVWSVEMFRHTNSFDLFTDYFGQN
jgi:hypothetical protein